MKIFWPILSFVALGFLVFGDGLHNKFLLDDEAQVMGNPAIHRLSNIPNLFKSSTMGQEGSDRPGGIYFKPLMMVAYALLWWLSPNDPYLFHLFQLLLCILNTIIVYLLFLRFLPKNLSWFLSLVFLLHPLNSEVVLYIADLQDALYMFFGLLMAHTLFSDRLVWKPFGILLFGLLTLAAMFCKETGLLFLVVVLFGGWLFKKERVLTATLASVLALVVYLYFRVELAGLGQVRYQVNQIGRADFWERLITSPAVIFSYFYKFFVPLEITSTQDWLVRELTLRAFWAPLVGCLLLLIFSLLFLAKTKNRTFAFFSFWVFAGMGFHSHIVVAFDGTVADRWFYFPMIGWLAMLGLAFGRLNLRLQKAAVIFCSLGLCAFTWRTYLRVADWEDNFTLCSKDLEYQPNAYDLHNNIGVEYFRRGLYQQAEEHFNLSTQYNPYWDVNWNNLGAIYDRRGESKTAQALYLKSLENGHYELAYKNYAESLFREKRHAELRTFLKDRALIAYPSNPTLRELAKAVGLN